MASRDTGTTKTGGMFAMPAAAAQKRAVPPHARKSERAPAPRLKFVIRRLSPGLTAAEFEAALGEEWRSGGSKVDWVIFKPGNISKE